MSNSIGDQATSGVLAGQLVITFPAPPKTCAQVPPSRLSVPVVDLVDAFMAQSWIPCSLSQPLICSGDQRIWHNFASILRRIGAVSLPGLYFVWPVVLGPWLELA